MLSPQCQDQQCRGGNVRVFIGKEFGYGRVSVLFIRIGEGLMMHQITLETGVLRLGTH